MADPHVRRMAPEGVVGDLLDEGGEGFIAAFLHPGLGSVAFHRTSVTSAQRMIKSFSYVIQATHPCAELVKLRNYAPAGSCPEPSSNGLRNPSGERARVSGRTPGPTVLG